MVVESGEPRFGIIERLRSAAGDVRWLETNKVPLRDLSGAEYEATERAAWDRLQEALADAHAEAALDD